MSKAELASNREELGVVEDDKRGWPDPSYSSSPELSSPPRSSPEAPESISKQSTNETASRQNGSITVNTSGVEAPTPAASVAPTPPVKERKKPGRKPKVHLNPDGSSATNTDVAPRKRAPRKPKDPNAAPPGPRKRKVTTSEAPNTSESRAPSGKQPKLSETEIRPAETKFVVPPNLTLASQNGNSEGIPITSFFNSAPPQPTPPPQPQPQTQAQIQQTMQSQAQSQPQPQPQSQPQPVRSSGQNYDPIRSNYDPVRETVVTHNSYNNSQGSPQAPYAPNRASESPSISSLVDPPNQAMASPSIATQSFFNQQQARLQPDGRTSIPPSPTTNRLAPSPAIIVEAREYYNAPPPAVAAAPPAKRDSISAATPAMPANISKKSTTSSTAASPKPDKKQKEKEKYPTPPPLPGSGLMQLGGTDGTEFRAPTVCFEVTIQPGEGNKYVNFTKMAEERYGWDALHPRLAAQRERLARVAAAGAALERNGNKESGDEASNDDSDSENDVEMGGMSDARNGTDGGEKRVVKKRMMKEDFYDKDDGFVDDSELQWEEQAVAANDGFFVYSGPLVPETAKPELESAPKRGRGRGRGGAGRGGPGSRGGRVPGAARPADANAPGVAQRPLAGPGSRGGAVTRKPRITKADRARMEQEKLEREKMGTLASAPNGYSGVPLASNIGTTPMVFNQ